MAGAAELNIRLIGTDLASVAFKSATSSLRGLMSAVTAPVRGVASLSGAILGIPLGILGATARGLGAIGLAGLGVAAVTTSVTGLANALGVGMSANLELTTARIFAFTKNMDATQAIIAQARIEADKSGQPFQKVLDGMASLIPIAKASKTPLTELFKTAQLLAASDPAQGFEGAAFALREALSGDFRSIVERFELPRARIKELMKVMTPLEAINQVMREMGITFDLVENQAGTLFGKFNIFQNAVGDLRRTLAAPIVEVLKDALDALTATLRANEPALTAFASAAGTAIAGAISKLIDRLPAAVIAFKNLMNTFTTVRVVMRETADAIRSLVTGGSGSFRLLEVAVQSATGIDISGLTGRLVSGFQFARNAVLTFIGALSGNWAGQTATDIDPVTKAFGNLGLFIRDTVLPNARALFAWLVGPGVEGLKAFSGFIQDTVVPGLQRLSAWFQTEILPRLQAFGNWFLNEALPAITPFADFLKVTLLGRLIELGKWLLTEGPAALTAFGDWFKGDGVEGVRAFGGLLKTIGETVDITVGPAFKTLASNAGDIFKELGPLATAFDDLLVTLRPVAELLGKLFAAIAASLPGLIRQVTGFIDQLTGGILLIQALFTGLSEAQAAFARGDLAGVGAALKKTWEGVAAAAAKADEGQKKVAEGQAMVGQGIFESFGGTVPATAVPFGPQPVPGANQTNVPVQNAFTSMNTFGQQVDALGVKIVDLGRKVDDWNLKLANAPADIQTAVTRWMQEI